MSTPLRNRIKEIRTVKGRELKPHPKNWRQHPTEQASAMRGLLDSVGQVDILRAVETPDGLVLVDGHLRSELSPDADWKVAILDLSPAEMAMVLATFDPVGAMAKADEEKLTALLAEIETDSAEVQKLLDEIADLEDAAERDGKTIDLSPTYGVIIHVPDEKSQRELLATADEAGFDATAILTGLVEPTKVEAPSPPVPAGVTVIERKAKIKRTVRVRQVEGMFDLPASKESKRRWELKLELPDDWNVGLIVGPSGSGKSTLAREWFPEALACEWKWPTDAAVVDGFPAELPIAEVTGLLSSVGFSSPPGWVKPFHVLSNGEQFRVNLARSLAEQPALAVIDEFTSVVDRTVAKVGSHAAQKAVRASGRRLVAVTCHYDVAEWLQPDWIFDMQTGKIARGSLRRRPELAVTVRRVGRDWWQTFREHHYLSAAHSKLATCFLAEVNSRPAAFCSVIHRMGIGACWATHRLVTLPDFQGVGLGNALHELVAGMYVTRGKSFHLTSSHPSMVAHCSRSRSWQLRGRAVGSINVPSAEARFSAGSAGRITTTFRYVGPKLVEEARRLGVT